MIASFRKPTCQSSYLLCCVFIATHAPGTFKVPGTFNCLPVQVPYQYLWY
jgi:hypothetical protein